MDDIDLEKFDKAKKEAENLYKSIGEVYCPYFKEKISFNAKGLEHIKFINRGQSRSHQDQYIRFRLILLAPQIIQNSHTLQGISKRNSFEFMNANSRWKTIMKSATYYEFVAVINGYRVRVILKEVEGGDGKYFWSIIPFWKMDKITGKRIMCSGKPELD